MKNFLGLFGTSQVFISICALLLSLESYLISGVKPGYVSLGVIFFSTLFVYNAAMLKLSVKAPVQNFRLSITLEGRKQHIVFCLISSLVVLVLLSACHLYQVIIFIITAGLSFIYMMPVVINGHRIKGVRNHLVLKNILLSLIWAFATVLFPLAGHSGLLPGADHLFIFIRHFLFIYALTVVFDIRDVGSDEETGMNTLPVRYGEQKTRLLSWIILLLYVLFIVVDPYLGKLSERPISAALYLSAFFAALAIGGARRERNKLYFTYIVDGVLVIQFLLVLLFTEVLS